MLFRIAVFLVLTLALNAAEPTPLALQRLVLADTEEAALAAPPDFEIVRPVNLPLLDAPDFPSVIAPLVGRPITTELLNDVGNAIAKYAREHDRLITRVLIPNQNVTDGTVRLVVVFGRYSDIAFRGNRWFSRELLEERLGIKPGDEVRLSVLEDAVNWANTNPFRMIKVLVDPINNQPGKANLLVGVQERWPWRLSAIVDNYGNAVLGEWHYAMAVQAGNLWGRDHQASYQFVTTDDIDLYQAHAMSYRIPLRWRHFLEFTASYAKVNPTFGTGNIFAQQGRSQGAGVRYRVPIRSGDSPIEIFGGMDLRRGNNNLEFAGTSVYATDVDTIQFTVGGTWVRRDKRGAWVFTGAANASPGYLNKRNDARAYGNARLGAKPHYVFSNVSLQRLQALGQGWDLSLRLVGQLSSTNLVGEQLTAGGATSVRGYTTNIYAGDEGLIFSSDLLTPAVSVPLAKVSSKLPALQTRFAVFFDAARLYMNHSFRSDVPMSTLASVGVGLRANVANNFSLNFDYGVQLRELPAVYKNTRSGQGHVRAVLAF